MTEIDFTRLCNLPAFRPAVNRLLSISPEADTAMDEYIAVFRSDPALATEVLRIANSGLLALRSTVTSVRHAVVVLGLDWVRSLALQVALRAYAPAGRGPETRQIWRHSMASALIGEALGVRYGIQRGVGYTAGLVHDVGRLGLMQAYGKTYASPARPKTTP